MDDLAIGDVARQAGIRPSAVRYYESIGLLPAPRRVSGRRRYDRNTVQLLKIVQLAQQKIAELDALIERAEQMKHILVAGLQCDCLRLEDCAVALESGRCTIA